MPAKSRFALVIVTAPDLKASRRLAKAALNARVIACANLVSKVESHYWWKDKIEKSTEVVLLMKTTFPKLKALERLILTNHPYDTPEFVVLALEGGSRRYLDWLAASVR